jgi:hypothetical protein
LESPNATIEAASFDEIAAEFHHRVARMVWDHIATVDERCRPHWRIMPPIIERDLK